MFFMTKGELPEGVGFSTFDMTHLLWLLAGILVCIGACILYKKLSPKGQKTMLTILGIYIVFQEMLKNTVLIIKGDFGWGYLPFHLCGISILFIGFNTIKQTQIVRNFLYYFGLPGAALALLFPNWTAEPFLNFFHMHSFTIHILIVMYPLILVTSGQVETSLKSAFKSLILLIGFAIPVYGLNLLWDTNFMFLMHPDKGNPLELFEQLLGSHLWGFPILLPVVILIMYLPVFIVAKVKKQKPIEEKQEVTV